jgi:hypothetical protein
MFFILSSASKNSLIDKCFRDLNNQPQSALIAKSGDLIK